MDDRTIEALAGGEPDPHEVRDDTEVLTDALHAQSLYGNLVLRHEVNINGVIYKPATYILQHVGPAPTSD